MTDTLSLAGKGAKGCAAYEVAEKRMVFFKDYWRADSSHTHPEIEVYAHLAKHQVPCVATAIAGSDVNGPNVQRMSTQKYFRGGEWFLERVHCRVVLQELCCPLKDYTASMELIGAIADAVRGE